MRNVFLLYMPPANPEAMVHYQDTIKNRVELRRIAGFVSQNLRAKLNSIFGGAGVAVWGSEGGPRNRSNYERMSQGDDVVIVEGDRVKLIGMIAAKVESEDLSRDLWKPMTGNASTTWKLIYFIANPRELDLPFKEFCRLFGYAQSYRLRGFTTVGPDKLEQFYARYDDLYSVLVRLQKGESVSPKAPEAALLTVPPPTRLPEIRLEDIDQALRTQLVSDHVRMQWKIARLGIKAGERVWVPVGDQAKLRQAYQFEEFDPEFSSGIDLPHSYVENIDVVWKQEFRIAAAYEIENSTSIYSGLLRFADLNVIAPNTIYPMFIVAPKDRKNRVREQLRRPAFKRLELYRKVRFLPYEAIDEIDTFFAGADSGLNVDVVYNKSETVE
jgi:hypothetical protein